jgi:SAM-dependent methyltransferase
MNCPVCHGQARHLFTKNDYDVHRCSACGLGFVGSLPSPETLAEFYASSYYNVESDDQPGYHSEYGELESGLKRMYRGFLHQIERRYPDRRFDKVLDVGCAYGFFLDVAERELAPSELVGLDAAPEAKEINTRKGYRFHHGFVEDADLPEAHFDLIFMGDAFEHVREPQRVVEKFEKILAPRGVLVITTVDFDAWLPRLTGPRWRLMTPPEHLHFWTRRSLARIFGDHGLACEFDSYWLYYPKSYVDQRFQRQFGFRPFFLAPWPAAEIPIFSFDVLIAFFHRRDSDAGTLLTC